MKKIFTWLALCSLFSTYSYAQNDNGVMRLEEFKYPSKRSIIHIPEVNGLQVLKCDFHMHTVFSDGYVWPNIRVEEAWKEGLDVIAFTEHVEYTPHKDDVKVGTLRSYVLAKELAAQRNILLIKAAEITRDTPPGHFNALFLANDSNLVADRASALDAQSIDVAINQDAFVF